MKIYIYVCGEDFFNHELSHCHVDKVVAESFEKSGWSSHIPLWEKRFNQKANSRLSLYEVDVQAGTCTTLLDLRHPLREKIVVNKAAVEARKSRINKGVEVNAFLNSIIMDGGTNLFTTSNITGGMDS